MEEIIENVRYQIPAEYYDKLLGGIILTGGGSNMKNIEQAFTKYTRIEKVRVAKFVTTTINSGNDQIKARNGMFNTVLGLLTKGDMNCAGKYIDPNATLFDDQESEEQPTQERKPRQIHEKETGTILTTQEEEKAAEEARRKKEEEERLKREQEEREAEEERKRKKEKSIWNRTKKWLENLAAPE